MRVKPPKPYKWGVRKSYVAEKLCWLYVGEWVFGKKLWSICFYVDDMCLNSLDIEEEFDIYLRSYWRRLGGL